MVRKKIFIQSEYQHILWFVNILTKYKFQFITKFIPVSEFEAFDD